jgi:LmbE family N-acetylglucosaminyl deacetylase
MECVDFAALRRGPNLDLIFPGWAEGERVAFYAPHDDDAALGAGYLIQAVTAQGGRPFVLIFCKGDAGYSTVGEKPGIVAVRKKEAADAYKALGVGRGDVHRFEIPDFELMASVGRGGGAGQDVFDGLVAFLRANAVSRIVFTSGAFEHWDHTAVFFQALYTSPQAGDPILADLGPPARIKSYLAYSVWSDFEPPPGRGPRALRADKGILAGPEHEDAVVKALAAFKSQGLIIRDTVAAERGRRRAADGFLELYQTVGLRRPIDYRPYFATIRNCRTGG